ncbi:MAG: AMP-binding protein [Planctomycetota bacterium]
MTTIPERFNLASWLLDERVTEGKGDRVAVIDGERTITYRELQRLVNRVGNGMLELDVDMEDRVLLVLPDGIEFVAAWLATVKVGAVPVAAGPWTEVGDYEAALDLTRARMLVMHQAHRARVEEAIPSSRHLRRAITVGEPEGKEVAWEEIASSHFDDLDAAPVDGEDAAFWLLRPGPGGALRAVCHSHAAVAHHASACARETLGLRASDVVLPGPLSSAQGLASGILYPMAVGAAVVACPGGGDPEGLLDLARRHRVTTLFAGDAGHLGTFRRAAEACRSLAAEGLSVWADGPSVSADYHAEWAAELRLPLYAGLFTDEGLLCASNRPGATKPGSCGRVVAGYQAKVLLPEGTEAPPRAGGDLWVLGGGAPAFWHDRERTCRKVKGDWVHVGTGFSVDTDGYFWYQRP